MGFNSGFKGLRSVKSTSHDKHRHLLS